ncbi:hypothetical protein [Citrobacter koseri]|uniref:hypothetical protein n=1 Tax=Citrobacter koseri TaxID=545 RepID=UPI000AD5B26A|nr:hypothetical protein [Citrobacter koseri]MBE0022837.1 hypothetical protein [Citrobacter koseri]MBE0082139.1 hypothetical protein [Citrobacter koseri]MDM9082415.1 hypothetical protein [Citrobacter koseri]MDM9270876.1 hypothetical protein [Citrobacter koseri]HDS4827844.1 hypothetical protein [Citrobacter koseri]
MLVRALGVVPDGGYALSGLRIVLCLAGLCTGHCAGWRLTPYPAYVLCCVLLACASGVVPAGG